MLSSVAPELVWGLLPRFVGVIYVLAFASAGVELVELGGRRGLMQTPRLLDSVRRDFPGIRRFFEYPTLLWFSCSDRALRTVPLLGMTCGALAIYGGPLGYAGLVLGWLLFLSLEPFALIYPWDTLLCEVGFLVLFVPMSEPLPELTASALPLPSVAFMARWLPLRLMLGFGKEKFVGAKRDDALYLRGFFVWMPLPNKLAWWGHHAPAWFLRLSIGFMFFAEVVAPLLGLFSGLPRLISFAALVGLSVGIMATGNWGFFNVGYMLVCVSLLDVNSSIFDLAESPWVHSLWRWPDVAVHAVMLLMFALSLFYLLTNSWNSRSWVHWPANFAHVPGAQARKLWTRVHRMLEPLRWIAPLRLVNGYGVFPPNATPPIRRIPVLEGSDDGVSWKQYGYRYAPSLPDSQPAQVAPHHPRFDQGIYYLANGVHVASLTGSAMPAGTPYLAHARATIMDVLMQRVLEHDPRTLALMGHNPFPDKPPKYLRVGLIAMTPERPSERRRTGRWWHVQRLGSLTSPRCAVTWADALAVPHPETFNPDFVALKRRSRPLRAVIAAYAAGRALDDAVIEESDLCAADVARFWDEFVPFAGEHEADWSQIHALAEQLNERFGVPGLYRMERILERYVWILRERIAQHPVARELAEELPVSNFRYHMILHTALLRGRVGLLELLEEPTRVAELAQRSSDATQLWLLTLLRYEPVMSHVCSFRWAELGGIAYRRGVPGLYEYYPYLVEQVPPTEQFRPEPVKDERGEFTIAGFYPPPAS